MNYFSDTYEISRQRFREKSATSGGKLWKYPIASKGPNGDTLTIDVCRIGPDNAEKLLIISSGTHGVEGFFGSSVQLAFLDREINLPQNVAVVMIHAVNPYGFAHLRRVNEDNIDMNRNFIPKGEIHAGAHPGYAKFNGMLNPEKAPSSFEFFLFRALFNIMIHGLPNLKNAIAQGQYEYPKGIFFGGKKAAESQIILKTHFREWVGDAMNVVHLDMHTGLGKSGTYVLGAGGKLDDEQLKKWRSAFGAKNIQTLDPSGELYEIRGEFGSWCQSLFPDRTYATFLAEFGTYPILKVIKALCEENRATHWGHSSADLAGYRTHLREIFAPKDKAWREEVTGKGLKLVDQALSVL